MSLEIFENTLLKLIVRRGTDVDRQNVLLDEGELGYTTDTKKLYIGDGATYGGVLIGGNQFKGSVGDITTLTDVVSGDLAYDNNTNSLYYYMGGDPSVLANWGVIGGTYTSGDTTITIANNTISVGTISGNNFSPAAIGNSLKIANNQLQLDESEIKVNRVSGFDDVLKLPSQIQFGDIQYTAPQTIGNNLYLKTKLDGTLEWGTAEYNNTFFVSTTAGQVPVGSIMPYVSSNAAPFGWLLCNGGSVSTTTYPDLFNVIGYTYGGTGSNFNVPNLTNKTLYGVTTLPGSSTTVQLASSVNPGLSATGALYIIKAVSDRVASVTLTVATPLTAQVNGVLTGGAFNPLSGDIQIGLPDLLLTSNYLYGGIEVDTYGRVVSNPTITDTNPYVAPGTGIVNTTTVINPYATTSFLETPVTIATLANNQTGTYTICCYPYITDTTGTSTGDTIPVNAKGIILDSYVSLDSSSEESVVVAALHPGYLNGVDYGVGGTEYIVNKIGNRGGSNSTQVIVPLSSSPNGYYGFGLRCKTPTLYQTSYVRIVGYTV